MKILLKVLLLCIFDCFALSAQTDNVNNQRKAFKLILFVNDQNFYEANIDASQYLNGPNILQIYPGETIYIEVKQKDGVVSKLTSVKTNTNPEKTLEIRFSQETTGKKHDLMMLKVVNPFDMDLIYSADMLLMNSKKWVQTTVVPVKPKSTSYETWPDVIVSLALSDWTFSKKH